MRVLYVEDDESVAKSVQLMLESEGHSCDSTDNGKRAVELAKSNKYDIILLDIMLPDIDGYEVIKRLRASGVRTSILIQTGLVGDGIRNDGLSLGVSQYLVKPFNKAELIDRIEGVVSGAGRPPMPEPKIQPDAEDAQQADADERRQHRRFETTLPAKILHDNGIDCIILNMSYGGAAIQLPSADTACPPIFDLQIAFGTKFRCKVCWRFQDKIGVKGEAGWTEGLMAAQSDRAGPAKAKQPDPETASSGVTPPSRYGDEGRPSAGTPRERASEGHPLRAAALAQLEDPPAAKAPVEAAEPEPEEAFDEAADQAAGAKVAEALDEAAEPAPAAGLKSADAPIWGADPAPDEAPGKSADPAPAAGSKSADAPIWGADPAPDEAPGKSAKPLPAAARKPVDAPIWGADPAPAAAAPKSADAPIWGADPAPAEAPGDATEPPPAAAPDPAEPAPVAEATAPALERTPASTASEAAEPQPVQAPSPAAAPQAAAPAPAPTPPKVAAPQPVQTPGPAAAPQAAAPAPAPTPPKIEKPQPVQAPSSAAAPPVAAPAPTPTPPEVTEPQPVQAPSPAAAPPAPEIAEPQPVQAPGPAAAPKAAAPAPAPTASEVAKPQPVQAPSPAAAPQAAEQVPAPPPAPKEERAAKPESIPVPAGKPGSAPADADQPFVVDAGVRLVAQTLECSELLVKGHLKASVRAERLRVAPGGEVVGSAEVDAADVAGRFEGSLSVAGRLVIGTAGVVTGRTRYDEIVIEPGGRISGEILNGAAKGTAEPAAEPGQEPASVAGR